MSKVSLLPLVAAFCRGHYLWYQLYVIAKDVMPTYVKPYGFILITSY